jgi:hypothetical protein
MTVSDMTEIENELILFLSSNIFIFQMKAILFIYTPIVVFFVELKKKNLDCSGRENSQAILYV